MFWRLQAFQTAGVHCLTQLRALCSPEQWTAGLQAEYADKIGEYHEKNPKPPRKQQERPAEHIARPMSAYFCFLAEFRKDHKARPKLLVRGTDRIPKLNSQRQGHLLLGASATATNAVLFLTWCCLCPISRVGSPKDSTGRGGYRKLIYW